MEGSRNGWRNEINKVEVRDGGCVSTNWCFFAPLNT